MNQSEPLFDFEFEFTETPVESGGRADLENGMRLDLAMRITRVNSSVPVTFIMSDKFLHHSGYSVFCEAYLDGGSPAIAAGTEAAALVPGLISKPTLAPGAAVFLRDIPEEWRNSGVVVDKLAKLIEKCCKVDKSAKSRENLAEALREVLDTLDSAEKILRRNRVPIEITFPATYSFDFLLGLAKYDAAVLHISPEAPCFSVTVLISPENEHSFRETVKGGELLTLNIAAEAHAILVLGNEQTPIETDRIEAFARACLLQQPRLEKAALAVLSGGPFVITRLVELAATVLDVAD